MYTFISLIIYKFKSALVKPTHRLFWLAVICDFVMSYSFVTSGVDKLLIAGILSHLVWLRHSVNSKVLMTISIFWIIIPEFVYSEFIPWPLSDSCTLPKSRTSSSFCEKHNDWSHLHGFIANKQFVNHQNLPPHY